MVHTPFYRYSKNILLKKPEQLGMEVRLFTEECSNAIIKNATVHLQEYAKAHGWILCAGPFYKEQTLPYEDPTTKHVGIWYYAEQV